MVPGGIIVFDDYGTVKGATDAIDEFLKEKNKKTEKLSLCYIPSFVFFFFFFFFFYID